MRADTVLHNAKVYTKGEVLDAGIAIKNGRIIEVAKEAHLPVAEDYIDLNGCLALPGLIDVHVHLRDQLQAYKEDFRTGTAAAVVGGITSVLDMPNNQPITMDSSSLRERILLAQQVVVANVGFYSAFSQKTDEIEEVAREGAIAFKVYLTSQVGDLDIDDDEALLHAFNAASRLGVPVAVHAEDRKIIKSIADHEQTLGHETSDAYQKAHTPEAETKAVARILRITRNSSAHIHFCHISSSQALTLIQKAAKSGSRVSCEVTPHHLLLTSQGFKQQGNLLLTDPPVRSRKTMIELWEAVKARQIDIIASDHAPHSIDEKMVDSVWNVKPGIPGLETLLPLLLTKVNEGWFSVNDVVRLTAENPAKIFHLNQNGFLRKDYDANITVVDMRRKSKIDASHFYSKAKYSPFDKWDVKGVPIKTFVNGKLVMDEGEVIAKGVAGKILSPANSN
ncbi:MAG: dihydroorotase family protein [Candidatus Bathyarchaeota archaeon]|nr:MAG: dihydroorotase family protein [Candidatus Bathyarchaeota archaeon]